MRNHGKHLEHCEVSLPKRGISLEVRTDGPTGLHLVDQRGTVLALGSLHGKTPHEGLDLIILTPERELLPLGYFGIFLMVIDATAALEGSPILWSDEAQAFDRPKSGDLFDFGA
jgi:hypothetical protein